MAKANKELTTDAAIEQIVVWAKKQPCWFSAALATLALGAIDEADIIRLISLSDTEANDDKTQPLISESALRCATPKSPTVTLSALHSVEHVNCLAAGEALSFSPKDLTIIYGKNGSGKYRYTRIFKQVCRVRGKVDVVLPNVCEISAGSAAAGVDWARSGVDYGERWSTNTNFNDDMKHITVFDSNAAKIHYKDLAEAPFRPYPLELLAGLGRAIESVASRHKEEKSTLEAEVVELPKLSKDSVFKSVLAGLGSRVITDSILDMCKFTPADTAAFLQVRALLKKRKKAIPELAASPPLASPNPDT